MRPIEQLQGARPWSVDRVPREVWTALVVLLNVAALLLVYRVVVQAIRQPLQFDDSFMFQRYAVHLREGMGISWNPDRIHTAGMTSLGWFLAVIPVSLLPLYRGQPLAVASALTAFVGIAGIAFAASRLAHLDVFRRFWLLLPVLVLVIGHNGLLRYNMLTGMDTMLSFAALAGVSCLVWAWCRNGGTSSAVLTGLVAACSVIVRPENGLFAVLAPLLAALLLIERRRKSELLWAAAAFSLLLAAYLAWYRIYFHGWLPLSFYMKSEHPYRGYIAAWVWAPEIYLHQFLLVAAAALALPLMLVNRRTLRIAITFLVPLALTFLYLETVTQIMGHEARYYVPFLGPVCVAAIWMLDESLRTGWPSLLVERWWKIAAVVLILIALDATAYPRVVAWSQRRLHIVPYPAALLDTPASHSLPERPWFVTITVLANQVVKPLPAGSVIATSEVGLIGAAAPQVTVIDLAGLNDNEIARSGFSMSRLLQRKPLLIWFPHSDYTWQRREMFCSPELLPEYIVVGGNAFNFSLAIRRDTPQTASILEHVREAFAQLYPGISMDQYLVTSIHCKD